MSGTHFWKNKKVVVTGSNGFVGSALVEELYKRQANVVAITRSNWSQLKAKTKKTQIFLHCAALDGNAQFKQEHSQKIKKTNLKITEDVLDAVSFNKIPYLCLLSSAEVYSMIATNPISETNQAALTDDTTSGYVVAKRLTEKLSLAAANNYGFKVLILRPSNIYGAADTKDRLIPVLVRNIISSKPIVLLNNGEQKRNFIYIDDFVNILLKLVELEQDGIVNVASTEAISLRELALLIGRLAHKRPIISSQHVDVAKTQDRTLAVNKLLSVLDFTFTTLEDGLTKVIHNRSK